MTEEEIKALIQETNKKHLKIDQKERFYHLLFWLLFLLFWIGMFTFIAKL